MSEETAITSANQDDPQGVIQLVLDGLTSAHSQRVYRKALTDFLAWWDANGRPALTKATVQAYKSVLQESGISPATVNLRMSAIRKLAQEAADYGLIDQAIANGIARIKGVKMQGVRAGNWLTREQAEALINAPNLTVAPQGL